MANKYSECNECIHYKKEIDEDPCIGCGSGEHFEEDVADTVDYLEGEHYERD